MLKRIDYLYHFTKNKNILSNILKYGFKTSFAKETLADKKIIVPMISFSNILLRDVGTNEVLYYGDYAICLTREWGLANDINPVVYTYENGQLYNSLTTFLYNSLFLSNLQDFKSDLKNFSDYKCGPYSTNIHITNTPKEVMDILDYLSTNYDEKLVDLFYNNAKSIFKTNMSIFTLTKQYKVIDGNGTEFIAYNDREWRKLFSDLNIYFEGDSEYEKWTNTPKPHFNDKPFLLTFKIEDVKAVLVKSNDEIDFVIKELKNNYGEMPVELQLTKGSLIIGTKETLEKNHF